jgi:LPS-assembly protein
MGIMSRSLIHTAVIAICLLLTGLTSVSRAESLTDPQGVVIHGDVMTHDQATDIVHVSGAVHIEWQGMTMLAIEAEYNRTTQILTASGNVVLIKGGDIVRGSRLTFDTVSGKGEIDNGTMFLRKGNNFHIVGNKIKKTGEDTYLLEQGSFTTCEGETPAWKFKATSMDARVDDYASGKNVLFYVKDVPLLYFPYMVFPISSERQSGLLFPHYSMSDKKGWELDLPYYWAISPSQEATIDLDIQTKRGVGVGVDYRYLRDRGSTGIFGGYLIYDQTAERWRGSMAQTHTEIFSPTMSLTMAVNLTTDRSFLNDYGVNSGEYNRQSGDSYVNFLKSWDNYAFTANLRYSEDYYATSNSSTLQTLPELGFAAIRQQLWSLPAYFDLDASLDNLYRESGTTGQRLSLFPRLTLVTGRAGVLNSSFYAGVHLRGYRTDASGTGTHVKETDGDMLPEVGARFSTSLSRVYDVDGDHLKKLRHELIPEISYSYAPDHDQTRLPFYDYADRLVWQNMVSYSITSLLGGKFVQGDSTEYRDLSRIRLSQGYSLEGTRRDLLTMVDKERPWTDLVLETDTWIHPDARLTFDARYNVYDGYFTTLAPGIEIDDRRGDIAGVSYRMTRDQLDYLEGRIGTKLFRPWTLLVTTRYSLESNSILESVYSAEYRHQCWSLVMAWHERPGNHAFTVNFNLAGLLGKWQQELYKSLDNTDQPELKK